MYAIEVKMVCRWLYGKVMKPSEQERVVVQQGLLQMTFAIVICF